MMKLDENGVFQRVRTMRNVHLSASRGFALLSSVAFALLAGGAFAVDITWTGKGANNYWGTSANWDLNRAPSAAGDDHVHIPSGDWTIRVNDHPGRAYGKIFIDDGEGTVTLLGMVDAGTTFSPHDSNGAIPYVGKGRRLVVSEWLTMRLLSNPVTNGVWVVGSGGTLCSNGAGFTMGGSTQVFVMNGGTFAKSDDKLVITNNAEVVVHDGGLLHTKTYEVYGSNVPGEKGGLLRVEKGGTVWNDSTVAKDSRIYSGGRFQNLGGTVLWGADSDSWVAKLSSTTDDNGSGNYGFSLFLPQKGSRLNLLSRDNCSSDGSNADDGALYFAVNGDYSFGGEIFATNTAAAEVANPGFVCFGMGETRNVSLTGGGKIYANGIMNRAYSSVNLDVSALYLGSGGIMNSANSSMYIHNDLVLGAWGDWSSERAFNGSYTFAGDLEFDTLNCFDKTTTHTISLKAGFLDVTSLKAAGGGTVALQPNLRNNVHPAWPKELASLVVGDGTSLFVTNSTEILKTVTLSLGAGSTLTFDLAVNRYIDVVRNMQVGSGAKIVVTVPASLALTAGKIHPVLFAPADFAIPDGLVHLEGSIPSGWTLVRRANLLYLSDGEASVAPASAPTEGDSSRYWTGAEDGDIEKTENWYNAMSPIAVTSSPWLYKFAIFRGRKNMDVSVFKPIWVYGLCIDSTTGPFIFTGEQINTYSPPNHHREGGSSSNGGIMSNSAFPCVVNNVVQNNSTKDSYLAASYQSGSISLMADQPTPSGASEFYFCGDIRIGGAWTVSHFNVSTNAASANLNVTPIVAKCFNRLTLLSGASFSASEQNEDFDLAQQFSLAPSSTLTISGPTCRFLVANAHYIDGTLTVEGTLDAQAKQTFFGDGTNRFQTATGELDFKGGMTIVPGSLVGDVALSFKGAPTIAPEADWTLGGDASIDLEDRSTLTLATGGHKLKFAKPIVSKGTLAVTGNGTVEIATEGMSLDKVEMADGATFSVARNILSRGTQVDVLTVRDDDDSITFAADVPKLKKHVDERGYTIYSVKGGAGLSIFIR